MRALLGWLRWPGRMALTNYVLQASLVVLIFYGFGLGLMKSKIDVPQGWALGLAVCAVITGLSMAWLRRFEFAPLEWLWRILTYGRSAGRSLRALADLSAIVRRRAPRIYGRKRQFSSTSRVKRSKGPPNVCARHCPTSACCKSAPA